MTKAVIYARYSSLAQRDQSIEDQVAACRAHARRRGLEIVEVYADRHVSGTTANRPEFQRMVADSRDGRWGQVLVYKLDRFARDRADAAFYRKLLKDRGVQLVSVMESIPEGPEGVILEGVMDAFAEYYSANLRQNVLRGMTSNAERCLANGVRVLGYRVGADGTFEVDEETAPIVRELFERRAMGETYANLARWLRTLGLKTRQKGSINVQYVRGRLQDRRYIGEYHWGSVVVPGGMPAIVDERTWQMVRAQTRTRRTDTDYGLSGILYTADGARFYGQSTQKGDRRYRYYSADVDGSTVRYRAEAIEGAVEDLLGQALTAPGVAHEMAVQVCAYFEELSDTPQARAAQAAAAEAEKERENLIGAIASGLDPSLVTGRIEALSEVIVQANQEIASCNPIAIDITEAEKLINDCFAGWLCKNNRVQDFVSRIEVDLYGGIVTVTVPLFGQTVSGRFPALESQESAANPTCGDAGRVSGEKQWWAQYTLAKTISLYMNPQGIVISGTYKSLRKRPSTRENSSVTRQQKHPSAPGEGRGVGESFVELTDGDPTVSRC